MMLLPAKEHDLHCWLQTVSTLPFHLTVLVWIIGSDHSDQAFFSGYKNKANGDVYFSSSRLGAIERDVSSLWTRWLTSCFLYPGRHSNELSVPFVTWKTLIPCVNCVFWPRSGESRRRGGERTRTFEELRMGTTLSMSRGVGEFITRFSNSWRRWEKATLLKFGPLKLDHHRSRCKVAS